MRQKTKIDPDLLKQSNRSYVPPATDTASLDERGIIFGTDLAKSRQEHASLIGAVKQAEYTDEQIQIADKARAALIQAEIDKLNAIEVEKAKPWYWRIF